jgi:hypothetical protein
MAICFFPEGNQPRLFPFGGLDQLALLLLFDQASGIYLRIGDRRKRDCNYSEERFVKE